MISYQIQKRLLDLTVSLFLLIIFLPFWIVIPICILIESGWPVIYKHKRVGKDGKEFYLLKFRSMVIDADKILHQEENDLLQKFKKNDWKIEAKDDPRITKVGRFIRALTIDEFPQIFNVIRGEMSMVGPRAFVKKELEEQLAKHKDCQQYYQQLLKVKPGITGVWQTSGRNEIPFEKRIKMNSVYAQNSSVLLDLKILLKTPMAMISKW